ncbi:unnamed protein product [Linum trigynum]|uniref:Secreted protein n=1 Tax=Linum trigynum TaxID=586398 RepID=A0AAV2DWT4_9ROSI
MSIAGPLVLRTLARGVEPLVCRPVCSITTLLHYSHLLPRNLDRLSRFVRPELLVRGNPLFLFIINLLRCFWS